MAIVYKHIRISDNEIFYIGIGYNHKRAYSKKNRNLYWKNYTNKHQYKVEITHSNILWEEACIIEKYLIDFYGRKDLSLGNLLNMTDGGEGLINPSNLTLEKFKNARIGSSLSQLTKDKLRKAMINVKPINRMKVHQFDLNLNVINTYESIKDAENATKIAKSSISKCCKGTLKTAGKYIWKYA
jgi:hypothetical protein